MEAILSSTGAANFAVWSGAQIKSRGPCRDSGVPCSSNVCALWHQRRAHCSIRSGTWSTQTTGAKGRQCAALLSGAGWARVSQSTFTENRVTSAVGGAISASHTVCSVEDLPANLQKIVKGFQMVPDAAQRYKQLLYYASKLKPLAPEHHIQENKVVGCVSQVWVKPTLADDGLVYFEADSDSQLTKGLAALLVEGLSGATPTQILTIKPDFIQMLGLSQKLTASRNNGFLNMLLLMQKRTLAIFMEHEKRKKTEGSAGAAAASPAEVEPATSSSGTTGESNGVNNGAGATENSAIGTSGRSGRKEHVHKADGGDSRPIYSGMQKKLEAGLSPVVLEIVDESHQHAGHAGVHKGATETHFNVKIVSEAFAGLNVVKRHRAVYQLLQEEFADGLHALSLSTKTPEEVGMAVSKS